MPCLYYNQWYQLFLKWWASKNNLVTITLNYHMRCLIIKLYFILFNIIENRWDWTWFRLIPIIYIYNNVCLYDCITKISKGYYYCLLPHDEPACTIRICGAYMRFFDLFWAFCKCCKLACHWFFNTQCVNHYSNDPVMTLILDNETYVTRWL